MSSSANRTVTSPLNEVSRVQVTVPAQSPSRVRDAFTTAREKLNGTLATFMETTITVPVLEKAKKEGFILAVDPKDMPREKGYYFVDREKHLADSEIVLFKSIDDKVADKIIREGRWNEVLYVNQRAIDAAKEKRPVALDVYYNDWFGRFLLAYGWSDVGARVAISSSSQASEQQASLLRTFPKGATLSVETNGESFRIELPPEAIVRLEPGN